MDIPVLILTAEGDPAHPVTTARYVNRKNQQQKTTRFWLVELNLLKIFFRALANLSTDTRLYISGSYQLGLLEWPPIIADFLRQIK